MKKRFFALVIAIIMVMSCFAGCLQTPELSEEDLANMGYVKNPADNGWVKDPANNGWVQDPANNGWVKDPAANGWVEDPAGNGWVYDPANNGWMSSEGFIAAPKMQGKVIHWVPGIQAANVTYELDLAGETEYDVLLNGKLLEEYVDFTYDESTKEFEILGTTLYDLELELGKYAGYVFTEGGYARFEVIVIANATEEGSTIPMKTISDINLSAMPTMAITEPIPGVADLFITEVSTEMGYYNYVEVFNNTTEAYNLKDHRIVFADLTKQGATGATNGLFDVPLGGAGAAYIYQDYEIPALSSAIIWIVNTSPWEVSGTKNARFISEVEGAKGMILGNGEENLNVAKFKDVYGLDESVLVFPVRTNYMIGRSDYGDLSTGWGTALSKGSSNRWADINSSVANRGVQIQKMDETKVFKTEDGKFYTIEMDVLNREEDIYADGKLDENDILTINPDGTIGADANREFIHAIFARRVYVTSETDLTPTGQVLVAADGYNLYGCTTTDTDEGRRYCSLFTSGFITPVATAIVYPDLAMNDAGEEAAAKWGTSYKTFSMQYQAPAAGEHLSKFIPLEGERAKYEAMFAGNAPMLAGLGQEFAGYAANAEVKVPESSVYPTDYLSQNHNTAGRVTAMMIPVVQE